MTDWEKVVAFHGHPCCLLAVGYRAAKLALERLGAAHGLVAVVENRTCAADAVQILTGCTFGKRSFVFRDHGKYAFTFARAGERRALRINLRPGILAREGEDFVVLMEKVANGIATEEEQAAFYRRQEPLMKYILEGPAEEIFAVRVVEEMFPLPELCLQMVTCALCGEEVMVDRALARQDGSYCCRSCAGRG